MRTIGEVIYYTGDMANPSGWFAVTRADATRVDLAEREGDRTILGISASQIGDVYAGHCGTRFVTEAAYNAYRSERMAEYAKFVRVGAAAHG